MAFSLLCCSASVSFVWDALLSIAYHVQARRGRKGREYQVRRPERSVSSTLITHCQMIIYVIVIVFVFVFVTTVTQGQAMLLL